MNSWIARGRKLGYKQQKKTFQEVYATKAKHDEKRRKNKMTTKAKDQLMLLI